MTRAEFDKKISEAYETWLKYGVANDCLDFTFGRIKDQYIKSLERENEELRLENDMLLEENKQLSKTLDTKFCFRELAIDPPEF